MVEYIILFGLWILIIEGFLTVYFKKRVGVIALHRFGRTITTILSIKTILRYTIKSNEKEFEKDSKKFFNSLEKNVEYKTHTHAYILRKLIKLCGRENVFYEKTKMRSMFLEKLFVGKTINLFEKKQYYEVTFQIRS